jgi:hypothetical protein
MFTHEYGAISPKKMFQLGELKGTFNDPANAVDVATWWLMMEQEYASPGIPNWAGENYTEKLQYRLYPGCSVDVWLDY